LKHRIVGFVTDTGHDYELQAGNKSDPVRSQPGFELGPLFQRISVDPDQPSRSPVGYQNLAVVGDDARRLRKAPQRGEVAAGVMINHLDAS